MGWNGSMWWGLRLLCPRVYIMESFRHCQSSTRLATVKQESVKKNPSSRYSKVVKDKNSVVVKKIIESIRTHSQSPQKQKNISPVPLKFNRDAKDKVDIFKNPSAIYLSRKQISYQRGSSSTSPEKIIYKTPTKLPTHTKAKSVQVSENSQSSLKKESISLVPIKSIKELSPGIRKNQSEYLKEIHCDALKKISNFCDHTINDCPKIEIQEKSVIEKYTNDIKWLSSATKVFSKYDPVIAKELLIFSNNSRKDLDQEREKVVNLIKTGDFDPNINVFKLRVIKKKTQEF